MEVGKLYICEEYFLLLYPDWETAAAADAAAAAVATAAAAVTATFAATATAAAAVAVADYWSNRFGKPVLYAKKNIPLLILNNREKYVEVLVEEKVGWIIVEDWLELKEIDYA